LTSIHSIRVQQQLSKEEGLASVIEETSSLSLMTIPVEETVDGDAHGVVESPPEPALAPITFSSNIPSLLCAFSAAATTGGTTYAFGLYSAALKHNLHLTEGQLDSISTAFFVAGLFSFLPGLCSDHCGTKFALSLGGCTGAASLLLYWVVARQFVPIERSYLVFVLSGLGVTTFLSCALVTGAVFKIIVSSTGSGTKGSAVGAAKGYVGLGAGLYACLFQAIQSRGESDLDFLPMAALLFILCATIPALCLLPSKRELATLVIRDDCTPLHFRALYCSLITLAMIIVSNSMVKLYDSERGSGSTGTSYGMAFVLVSVWLGPILSLYALPRLVHMLLRWTRIVLMTMTIDRIHLSYRHQRCQLVRICRIFVILGYRPIP
jgi:hypothetical protein